MHRHGRFRHHGPRHFHRWGFWPGFFWPLGFAIFFFGGHWWPAILILIGVSILIGSFSHHEHNEWRDERPEPPPSFYDASRMTPPPAPKPIIVNAAPSQLIHRAELLPATCAQCGGPIRSHEVKWTGAQSAACPYCGSNLKMKKR